MDSIKFYIFFVSICEDKANLCKQNDNFAKTHEKMQSSSTHQFIVLRVFT